MMQQKINSMLRETKYILHISKCINKIHAKQARIGFSIYETRIEKKTAMPKNSNILYCGHLFGNEKK